MDKDYGFDKYYPRIGVGSRKWDLVYKKYDNLEDETLPLTVADMDFFFHKRVKEELGDYIKNTILGYTGPTDSYYQALKSHYEEYKNLSLTSDDLVLSEGVVTSIYNAVRAFTKKGDKVVLFTPIYPPFVGAVRDQEREVVRCPLLLKDGRYEINFENFENICKDEDVTCLILSNPHNPGGRVFTEEELEKIDAISRENKVFVISDEIHSDLIMPGHKHTTYLSLSEEVSRSAIVCSSVTKSYNIAGLKHSFVIIKDKKLKERFVSEFRKVGLNEVNMVGIKATELAYKYYHEWIGDLISKIQENHELLYDFFSSIEGFKPMKVEATYLAWVDFGEYIAKNKLSCEDFYRFIEEKGHFFGSHGEMFGIEGKNYFRINVAYPTEVLKKNLERLRAIL